MSEQPATMTSVDRLYADVTSMIRDYCTKYGCEPAVIGREALRDGMFIKTVLNKGSVTTDKLRKLEEWLRRDISPEQAREERLSPVEAS